MRWMRGVSCRQASEFLLLTPTGAMKTRCVRRLEGFFVWDFATLESVCWWSVECDTARSTQQKPTIQQKDELESGRRAKRVYLRQNILDKYGRTAGCPVVLKWAAHRGVPSKN